MNLNDWTLCVAPMLDWTDRHCRYFHRLLAPHARLYTEMVTTGAILRGDVARHLDFDAAEHPVALQLGGSEPADLAAAARLGARWGYDEINLNCGCPSERVQRGAFGACLMAEPELVADCVKAMQDAVAIPVTVKHRIGLDYDESYGPVRDFVGTLRAAGCDVFIVHARNAVLQGLSPKDNRNIPPLRYEVVQQLRRDFPDAGFILNGGLTSSEAALSVLQPAAGPSSVVDTSGVDTSGINASGSNASGSNAAALDGVMLGREAWHRPRVLSELSLQLWPQTPLASDAEVVDQMAQYAAREVSRGTPLRHVVRPMLGLAAGSNGARRWRQLLSDHRRLMANDVGLLHEAWSSLRRAPSAA